MKKVSIVLFAVATISGFSFVSYSNSSVQKKIGTNEQLIKLTSIKGAEKSGVGQSNQNW